jgi:uncharacterized phage protein (TIGR01671 family)
MNRTIKFRTWSEKQKQMVLMPDLEVYAHPDGSIEYHCRSGAKKPLMQFTGFKDKNSKEIYEGDILKTIGIYGNGKVVWDRVAYFIELTSRERESYHQFIDATGNAHEVIGNIYENPELLSL